LAISKELEAKILRYYFVERWRVNTIARHIGVHHSTVDRVLSQAGMPKAERSPRTSILDPYLAFIHETLEDHPTLSAQRLYQMVQERGYPGGPSHFRARLAEMRPRKVPEAYLRLRTLPGEQAQCDWGHFGHLQLGQAKRPLMAFVMVLSWSRQIFLRFYLNHGMANFLHGHVSAFEAWQGVARVCLYDNLKSAVLERRGDAIRFHPTMLALATHYRFEPRPVAVARGNEKGRVERAIRYIRDNFFAGRKWRDLDDLNAQADDCCRHHSANRRCPGVRSMTVAEAFAQEQPKLITLPDDAFPCDESVTVSIGKTPYARFDGNDYSVPHTQVRRTLSLRASLTHVRVLDGQTLVAEHLRCYDKRQIIEDDAHIEALWQSKHHARLHGGQDRLANVAPDSRELLQRSAQRGHPIKRTVKILLDLLANYGASELNLAIQEALSQQVPHAQAVQQVLERRREQRQQPPPQAVALSEHAKAIVLRPASLSTYDQLHTITPTDKDDSDTDTQTDNNEDNA